MIELLREELLKEKQIDTTIGTVIPTESKLQETKHLHRVLDGVRKFKEYFEDDKEKLKEDQVTQTILKHLDHEEDLLFYGKDGAKLMLNTLSDVIDMISSNIPINGTRMTRKWDGAPAVVCATDFHGKKFVALKHSWDNGSIFESVEAIDKAYADREGLGNKLKALFLALDEIQIPKDEIWMGDYLFSKDDIVIQPVNGEKCVTFKANTIVYAVPTSDPISKQILNADIGIVWHTIYTGESLDKRSLRKRFGASVDSLRESPRIFQLDANIPSIKNTVFLSKEETQEIKNALEDLETKAFMLVGNPKYTELISDQKIVALMQKWKNQVIRSTRTETSYMDSDSIINFIGAVYDTEIEKKKSEKGKADWRAKKEAMISNLRDKADVIDELYDAQSICIGIKNKLVSKLDNGLKSPLASYYQSRTKGFIPCGGEGYVVSDIEGNVAKLVSRVDFSYNNWDDDIIKGFEKVIPTKITESEENNETSDKKTIDTLEGLFGILRDAKSSNDSELGLIDMDSNEGFKDLSTKSRNRIQVCARTKSRGYRIQALRALNKYLTDNGYESETHITNGSSNTDYVTATVDGVVYQISINTSKKPTITSIDFVKKGSRKCELDGAKYLIFGMSKSEDPYVDGEKELRNIILSNVKELLETEKITKSEYTSILHFMGIDANGNDIDVNPLDDDFAFDNSHGVFTYFIEIGIPYLILKNGKTPIHTNGYSLVPASYTKKAIGVLLPISANFKLVDVVIAFEGDPNLKLSMKLNGGMPASFFNIYETMTQEKEKEMFGKYKNTVLEEFSYFYRAVGEYNIASLWAYGLSRFRGKFSYRNKSNMETLNEFLVANGAEGIKERGDVLYKRLKDTKALTGNPKSDELIKEYIGKFMLENEYLNPRSITRFEEFLPTSITSAICKMLAKELDADLGSKDIVAEILGTNEYWQCNFIPSSNKKISYTDVSEKISGKDIVITATKPQFNELNPHSGTVSAAIHGGK